MMKLIPMAVALVVALAPALASAQMAASSSAPVTASPAARADQLEIRIKDLHTRLKITPAQEPLWTSFTAVMRANAAEMGDLYRAGDPRSQNASEALRHYARIAQAHSDEINKLVAPFQALYDSMAPAQKTGADEAFRSFGRNGRLRG